MYKAIEHKTGLLMRDDGMRSRGSGEGHGMISGRRLK